MTRRIGPALKLVDAKDNYLGVLHIPLTVPVPHETDPVVYIRLLPETHWWQPMDNVQDLSLRHVLVRISHHVRDAVCLEGKTPEEISQEEGFAFTPSLQYVLAAMKKEFAP